ncbi:hypothetical protein V3C99_005001, partial [Haemonchus contortus]
VLGEKDHHKVTYIRSGKQTEVDHVSSVCLILYPSYEGLNRPKRQGILPFDPCALDSSGQLSAKYLFLCLLGQMDIKTPTTEQIG